MATKEDILEQIVEEYLIHQGYFVRHNVKFIPKKDHPDFVPNQDSNHSDIDVIGYHPLRNGDDKVVAVSCKSWQGGFNPASEIRAIQANKIIRGREAWKAFRELVNEKWSKAFIDAVWQTTGSARFTHVTAVTKVTGNNKKPWENHQPFINAMNGNPVRIVTFEEMISSIQSTLTTTLAATEVGRMLQLFGASGANLNFDSAPKETKNKNKKAQ